MGRLSQQCITASQWLTRCGSFDQNVSELIPILGIMKILVNCVLYMVHLKILFKLLI